MKKFFRAAALIAAAVLAFPIAACTENGNTDNTDNTDYSDFKNYYHEFYAMGTVATLRVSDHEGNDASFNSLQDEVGTLLYDAEDCLSAVINSSYISAFNAAKAGEKVELDETSYAVLSLAKNMYEFTNGYYNPAVYYSVKAFGFPLTVETYPSDASGLPDAQKVEAFRSLASHFGEVQLSEENGAYYAKKPYSTVTVEGVEYSLAVDLGGIGKGWCADRVDEILDGYGYKYGYFDFGSSSMAIKRYYNNSSKAYDVQPRDPRWSGSSGFCSIPVKDSRLSTSGDYEQYYEFENGDGSKTRYCHIINPFTGAPIQTGVASVTVIGGSAAEDDALTTALSCMDKSTAVDFINEKLSDRTIIMLIFEGGEGKIITNRPDSVSKIISKYSLGNRVENGRIVLNDVA